MIDILYIVGMQRSGSTALERLLAAHANVVAIGEARSVWTNRMDDTSLCSCRRPIRDCPVWRSALCAAFGPAARPESATLDSLVRGVDRARYVPMMHHSVLRSRRFARAFEASQEVVRRFYEGVAEAAPERVIVEATKVPWYAHLLSTVPGLRVAYIHLVRDSRAVAYSRKRKRDRPDMSDGVPTMPSHGAVSSALTWDANFALSLALVPYVRPRILRIRYEDFARHAASAVGSIQEMARAAGMRPLGEPGPDADPDWYHSAFSNPVRFDAAFSVRPDDEWQTEASASSRLIVGALTLPFLAAHRTGVGFTPLRS